MRPGSPTEVVGSWADVTERKGAERRLLESEEEYRLLFDSNPHPMWVFDAETLAFLAVNDAAVRLYGFSRDEFLAHDDQGDPPARGGPGPSRVPRDDPGLSEPAGDPREAPQEGRLAPRGRGLFQPDRVPRPARPPGPGQRRHREEAAGSAAPAGAEDGGRRPPGRRRRPRLQQPAERDHGLQRAAAQEPRSAAPAARSGWSRSRRPPSAPPASRGSSWPSAASRCCSRGSSTSTRSWRTWRRCSAA